MGTTRCNFTVAAAVTRQDDTMFKTHPWSPCKSRQYTSLQYTWIWNDLLGADLNVHSSMLGTEWECQHWVRSAILWWRERISVMAIVKQLTRKARAAWRLFVKYFACEVWQSQRRLGYTSARLALRVSALNRGSGLMSEEMMSKCGVGCDILTLVSF